jgi:ubiquinone/menaquinone biosynthesis C-methylase UbiE
MVELAQERNKNTGFFFLQDLAAPFKKLNDNSFDIIICVLAKHYIKDWSSTIQEFNGV